MPVNRNHPIRILPYFGYRNRDRLHISARALRARKNDFAVSGRWRAFRTMLAQFASHEIADLEVTLQLVSPDGEKHIHSAATDKEGFVHFDIELEQWALPLRSEWEVVAFGWDHAEGKHCVEGHILAPGQQTEIGIISDIDDTIIETGITGNVRAILRNWKRVLAQMPEERLAVPGVDSFYNALGGNSAIEGSAPDLGETAPTSTQRPFFYVSSSPWNLYSYLVAYKKLRKLPLGPIAKRDWGANRETFGSSSHGLHKRHAIDRILGTFSDLRFALIGDDTQGDLTAYGAIVEDHPDRIAAVFIRRAGEAMSAEERAAKDAIENAGVPLWLGPDYTTGRAFLRSVGLFDDEHAAEIVKAKTRQDAASR